MNKRRMRRSTRVSTTHASRRVIADPGLRLETATKPGLVGECATRRAFLTTLVAMPLCSNARSDQATEPPRFADVVPNVALSFPRDHGAHARFRTEWWYVTGLLQTQAGREYGFQVTFFQQATGVGNTSKSAFAPRQLIIAHAAVTDVVRQSLIHEEKVARAVLGLAGASDATTDVWLDRWRISLQGDTYTLTIPGEKLSLSLRLVAPAPPLLQGENGFSRKGPLPRQASYYYSRPQLQVSGTLALDGRGEAVAGRAWLDHEWSSEVMSGDAVGWDWIGINLSDGGALMAFRMRDARGEALWAAATRVTPAGDAVTYRPSQIRWQADGEWQSPASGARYPAQIRIDLAEKKFVVAPRIAAQEVDARRSTGTIYWEGLSDLVFEGARIGTGYLEMTGYWKPLKF